MEKVKQNFSIKDLENLSGVKAHTIRIWEKRYSVLSPDRTPTNIRTYDVSSLQKLLNISLLNNYGYKISKISKLSDAEINALIQNIAISPSKYSYAINAFKVSMYNFDQQIFFETYDMLAENISFSEIYEEAFIPLLNEIGLLWQTDTIRPSHEHFISNLIKQKIFINIAQIQPKKEYKSNKTYVLFLPHNEIHEIGLLYLYYQINLHNHHCIFLGPSMPFADMKYLTGLYENLVFASFLTIEPVNLEQFIKEFEEELCADKKRKLILYGKKAQKINFQLPENVKVFSEIREFTIDL